MYIHVVSTVQIYVCILYLLHCLTYTLRMFYQMELFENSFSMENLISYFQTSQDGRTNFLKVHAPEPLLDRYAEIINMQKPIKARYIFCEIV